MITPIFIPRASSPSRCPGCHDIENTKTVCRNCGYEYRDDGPSTFQIVATVVVGLALVFWVFFTVMEWVMPIYDQKTLVEVLVSQWKWLSNLRIW